MSVTIPYHYGQVIHQLQWNDDPEPMALTIGVWSTDAADSDDVVALAGRFHEAIYNELLPKFPDVLNVVSTEVQFQLDADPTQPLIVGIAIGAGAGPVTGGVIPQNTAYLIQKRTSTGGRSGRGRWFLPGCGEAFVNNIGAVTSGKQASLNAALADYLDYVDNTTDSPFSRPVLLHNAEGAYADADPHVITAMTVDPLVSTQRRRLRR